MERERPSDHYWRPRDFLSQQRAVPHERSRKAGRAALEKKIKLCTMTARLGIKLAPFGPLGASCGEIADKEYCHRDASSVAGKVGISDTDHTWPWG